MSMIIHVYRTHPFVSHSGGFFFSLALSLVHLTSHRILIPINNVRDTYTINVQTINTSKSTDQFLLIVMGNTHSNTNTTSTLTTYQSNSSSKQIHISTDHADGFYFTGECLSGTVKIPLSFLHHHHHHHHHHHSPNHRAATELIDQRALCNAMTIELVGDAIYSAEVDTAADSDGHATHRVNLCRQRCFVSSDSSKYDLDTNNNNSSSQTRTTSIDVPIVFDGTFQLIIPDGLPPSLSTTRTPSVTYTLELSLSSSRCRYQIPLILSSRGYCPHPLIDTVINHCGINEHDIRLRAHLARRFYRPGEQISVRVHYFNPQQRSIRSIRATLVQFYRIHNDQHHLQFDGKEWTFDVVSKLIQREWNGEARLQLPDRPLVASFPSSSVGTRQTIQCELDYRILIELNEKKGDDIRLALSSIHVTYQE
jgi:hypothetical protein